jgi:hypothetical protein
MKNLIDKLRDNDVVVRAVKTFVQSFAAVLLATDNPVSKSAFVAAFAAAISAVWNSVRGLRS